MPSKVWDEITYPFPNINGAAVEVISKRSQSCSNSAMLPNEFGEHTLDMKIE